MRGSTSTSEIGAPAGDAGARILRPALIAGAAGAILILLDFFGASARAAGLVAVVGATILSAPYAERPGAASGGWWTMLAVGSLLALGGTALSLGVESLGGLVTVAGGGLIAVACALGYPLKRG